MDAVRLSFTADLSAIRLGVADKAELARQMQGKI
jgi:hypothetical protein